MKPASFNPLLGVGLCATLAVVPLAGTASPREHLSLDAGWKFHLGDDWPGALRLDKAGAGTGPASDTLFRDVTWRTVDLPHDWTIELPFDRAADQNHGFMALGPGFETNSIGWYRRVFELPASDSLRRIWLRFDGVFRDATVWVDGCLVRRHEGGDDPFCEDITDVVKFGDRNVIAVRCRNGGGLGRLNPNVNVDIALKPSPLPWSRSLFNGLARIIVQSTREAGEFRLTARADGHAPASTIVQTHPVRRARPCRDCESGTFSHHNRFH